MSDPVPQLPEPSSDSRIAGVSVRAWLALMLIGTVCAVTFGNFILSYFTGDLILRIEEPVNTLAVAAVSFYFGSKSK